MVTVRLAVRLERPELAPGRRRRRAGSARASCSTATARSPPTRTSSPPASAPSIRRAREVYVEFADGNRVEAKILGDDPDADVALLKVDTDGPDAAPAAARRRAPRSQVGDAGGGDRLAVRRGPVALGRRRLGGRPLDPVADELPDPRRDPDRRRDQPRQLGRPAGRRGRAGDRHQPADQDALRRRRGRRLRGADRRRQALARPSCAATARRATRTSASRRSRSTRSSSSASTSRSRRAPGSRPCTAGGPAEKAGLRAAAERVTFQATPFRTRRRHRSRRSPARPVARPRRPRRGDRHARPRLRWSRSRSSATASARKCRVKLGERPLDRAGSAWLAANLRPPSPPRKDSHTCFSPSPWRTRAWPTTPTSSAARWWRRSASWRSR